MQSLLGVDLESRIIAESFRPSARLFEHDDNAVNDIVTCNFCRGGQ